MDKQKEILIVGAGPSGLSMAIFLCELGYKPRIIDKKDEISQFSKALAVNPTSLDIFKRFGITDKFLSNGRKMNAVNIWKGNKHIYTNKFAGAHPEFPFMLIQPQKESEEILLEELKNRGIQVEYETELISINDDSTSAVLFGSPVRDTVDFDFIVGADGGRSVVRQLYDIPLDGFRYDEEWELYDIELDISMDKDEGHILLYPEGGMIMIRLKGDVWRIAGSMESILDYFPHGTDIGEVKWESKFRIHHKVAKELTKEKMVLIGDAAHLHSPVGARGMNLGIQDAFVASTLLNEDRMRNYNSLRHPYLSRTVNQINNITMGLAGDLWWSTLVRKRIDVFQFMFPFIMPRVRKFIMGLN